MVHREGHMEKKYANDEKHIGTKQEVNVLPKARKTLPHRPQSEIRQHSRFETYPHNHSIATGLSSRRDPALGAGKKPTNG